MWCDDLVVFSKSAAGLQNTIDRISQHFNLLGLSVNETKTKVVIFNNRGVSLKDNPENTFLLGGARLAVVDEYQYLGLKLKASGSFSYASNELYTKASRAYFSISNVLYTHKKWPIKRALSMFDTIVWASLGTVSDAHEELSWLGQCSESLGIFPTGTPESEGVQDVAKRT